MSSNWLPSARVPLIQDGNVSGKEMYGWMRYVDDSVAGLLNAAPIDSGVTSVDVSGGVTGLTYNGGPIKTHGVITADGILNIQHGGTGTNNPLGLTTTTPTTATITGSFPNQSIAVTGGSSGGFTPTYEAVAPRPPFTKLYEMTDTSGTTCVATIGGTNGTYSSSGIAYTQGPIKPSGRGNSIGFSGGGYASLDLGIGSTNGTWYVEFSVYVPSVPTSGQIIYLRTVSNGGTANANGFGFGIGDGSTYEGVGSKWMGLTESVAWINTNIPATAGNHIIAIYSENYGGSVTVTVDGVIVVGSGGNTGSQLGTSSRMCMIGADPSQNTARNSTCNISYIWSRVEAAPFGPSGSNSGYGIESHAAIARPRWEAWKTGT